MKEIELSVETTNDFRVEDQVDHMHGSRPVAMDRVMSEGKGIGPSEEMALWSLARYICPECSAQVISRIYGKATASTTVTPR